MIEALSIELCSDIYVSFSFANFEEFRFKTRAPSNPPDAPSELHAKFRGNRPDAPSFHRRRATLSDAKTQYTGNLLSPRKLFLRFYAEIEKFNL